jgi:hypothetical protein
MLLRTWRLISLLLSALAMAMAFCHLLQMVPRMGYDGALWRRTQSMYRFFGPPVGTAIEGGALISTAILSYLVRRRPSASRWTWAGTLLYSMAQLVWWLRVRPVNATMVNWRPEARPQQWTRLRTRWEYAHASRAILMIAGFAALLYSVLVETPQQETASPQPHTVESLHTAPM